MANRVLRKRLARLEARRKEFTPNAKDRHQHHEPGSQSGRK